MNEIVNKRLKANSRTLAKESTVGLVRRIVENSDKSALEVLLETRKLFRIKNGPPLLLHEFLLKLRDGLIRSFALNDVQLADCAYDLTLTKYSNLPVTATDKKKLNDNSLKGTGTDCRNYYRAFLNKIHQRIVQGNTKNQNEEESYAGVVIQKMVYNNFLQSKLECQRDTPFSVRYQWEVDGVKLYLWYPSYMTAKEFRNWLEENIKDLNHRRSYEQKRIQSLIDVALKRGYHISTDDPDALIVLNKEMGKESSPTEQNESQMFVGGLSEAVARRKVEEIQELRPSIAKLGKKTITVMILQIFSDLSVGAYSVTETADQYGVSKPTFSRFAGNKWFEKIEQFENVGDIKNIVIPDLWKNTAEILAENPYFLERVLDFGFADILKTVIEMIKIEKEKANDRE